MKYSDDLIRKARHGESVPRRTGTQERDSEIEGKAVRVAARARAERVSTQETVCSNCLLPFFSIHSVCEPLITA